MAKKTTVNSNSNPGKDRKPNCKNQRDRQTDPEAGPPNEGTSNRNENPGPEVEMPRMRTPQQKKEEPTRGEEEACQQPKKQ
ncbi:hypothetical protein NDU88_003015 [Pleurodeles waltl]|uniref:Uncharacterized protein n=1 Tax=Pleurodeles waltl TaxID=8319 RepID=A0AAV7RD47_PLEWA|nr:hypothetical protein NDU88_003015 [Pleurodeles waltl]